MAQTILPAGWPEGQSLAVAVNVMLEGWTEAWVLPERELREQHSLETLERLAASARERGDHSAAERYLRRAIHVAREIEDPAALDYAYMLKGLYSVSVGHWQDVRSSVDECQAICERIGDHVNWANAQIVRFWMHHYLGETEESAQAAHRLLVRAQKIGNLQQEVWALCSAGVAELRGDRPAEAVRYLEGALGVHEDKDQNKPSLRRASNKTDKDGKTTDDDRPTLHRRDNN